MVRVRCFTGMRRYLPEGKGGFEIELAAGGVVLDLETGPSPADDTAWATCWRRTPARLRLDGR